MYADRRNHLKVEDGFSLVELLIVVSIILIIASMAIPNLLRARIAANEASAVGSIRTINTAEVMYQASYPQAGYADALTKLGPNGNLCNAPTSAAACLIDAVLARASTPAAAKNGYYFLLATEDRGQSGRIMAYTVSGSAASYNQTGIRDFCSTEDGVIRVLVPASQSSPDTTSVKCGTAETLQ